MKSEILPHWLLPEPALSFHPDRRSERDIHPLRGLAKFGPYSKGIMPDPIRIATIAPAGDHERLYAFLRELNSQANPHERMDYLPPWPGFNAVFGTRMAAADKRCQLILSSELESNLQSATKPHVKLAEHLTHAMQSLMAFRTDFDVLFIYLPQRWSSFFGSRDEDFDLHDYLKASSAGRGVPLQIVREDRALSYPDRASVLWRIGLAIYAKAGGVPWKLADMDPDTAFIGISYALRTTGASDAKFVTCCSQVFDADGSGLEFMAYDAHEIEVQRENPFLSRTEMFRVMTRSIDLYRRRHAGRSPRRVMVHKTTEFKPDEIDGCMEAFHLCEAVDLLQVVEDVDWRGVRIDQGRSRENNKGTPAMFPVQRGTLVGLGDREALLWTHGDVTGISSKGAYFQGARATPKPLKLVRHAGHGSWDDTASAILALSKMDWNNDALYDTLPVTLEYAKVLARVIKRMHGLGTTPYQFRYFM